MQFHVVRLFFISCVHHWSAMPNETCAKQRDTKKEMRENTDSEIFYEKYILSERIAMKLESIKNMMKENIAQANPMWKMIAGEVRIIHRIIQFLISWCSLELKFLNCKFCVKHLVFKWINLFFWIRWNGIWLNATIIIQSIIMSCTYREIILQVICCKLSNLEWRKSMFRWRKQ